MGRLALGRTQCLLNAIIPFPDFSCFGGCQYILAELCPILVCTSPRGLLNLAPGSSENLQVPLAGLPYVLNQGFALSLDDGSHFGRLGVKPIVSLWCIFPEGSLCGAWCLGEFPTSLWQSGVGLWGTEFSLKSLREL